MATQVVVTDAPAPAPIEEKHPVIRLLDSPQARQRIEPMVPHGVDYRKVLVDVYLAVSQNPKLAECTPASLVQAVARAASTGGQIGRDVHLVPFNTNIAPKGQPKKWETRCQAIEDYKFLAEIVVRTGGARSIVAKSVYANETFLYEEGTEQVLRHVPVMDPAKRGALVGAYAMARIGHNNLVIHVMSVQEIEAIRQKFSKQWNEGPMPHWYPLKACVRQIIKLLPKNPRLLALLQRFDAPEEQGLIDIGDAPEALEAPAPHRQLSPGPMPTQQYEESGIEDSGPAPVTEDMPDPYADGDGFPADLDLEYEDEQPAAKSKGRKDALRDG
jgi:recombination protein RecT